MDTSQPGTQCYFPYLESAVKGYLAAHPGTAPPSHLLDRHLLALDDPCPTLAASHSCHPFLFGPHPYFMGPRALAAKQGLPPTDPLYLALLRVRPRIALRALGRGVHFLAASCVLHLVQTEANSPLRGRDRWRCSSAFTGADTFGAALRALVPGYTLLAASEVSPPPSPPSSPVLPPACRPPPPLAHAPPLDSFPLPRLAAGPRASSAGARLLLAPPPRARRQLPLRRARRRGVPPRALRLRLLGLSLHQALQPEPHRHRGRPRGRPRPPGPRPTPAIREPASRVCAGEHPLAPVGPALGPHPDNLDAQAVTLRLEVRPPPPRRRLVRPPASRRPPRPMHPAPPGARRCTFICPRFHFSAGSSRPRLWWVGYLRTAPSR